MDSHISVEMNEQPVEMNKKQPAEILDIIDKTVGINSKTSRGAHVLTKGGLEIPIIMMKHFPQAILKPVTTEGNDLLKMYVERYEQNYDIYNNGNKHGPKRKYIPVTTLAVESPPVTTLAVDSNSASGGKRNKSKKPKRRNSRSKRRKTLSKRRR